MKTGGRNMQRITSYSNVSPSPGERTNKRLISWLNNLKGHKNSGKPSDPPASGPPGLAISSAPPSLPAALPLDPLEASPTLYASTTLSTPDESVISPNSYVSTSSPTPSLTAQSPTVYISVGSSVTHSTANSHTVYSWSTSSTAYSWTSSPLLTSTSSTHSPSSYSSENSQATNPTANSPSSFAPADFPITNPWASSSASSPSPAKPDTAHTSAKSPTTNPAASPPSPYSWASSPTSYSWSSPQKPQQTIRECSICTESRPDKQFAPLLTSSCTTHTNDVCKWCVAKWITSQLSNNQWNQLRCPLCPQILEYAAVRAHATPQTFARYDNLAKQDALSSQADHCWNCPVCDQFYIVDADSAAPIVSCYVCSYKACFSCDTAWHMGLTCKDYQVQLRQAAEDRKSRAKATQDNKRSCETIKKTTKQCPRCRAPIEMNQGCDHMTCRCRYEFCWVCFADYNGPRGIRAVGNAAHEKSCRHYRH